jgi:DNA-binding LacI/PurR family transcriptional regulator
MVSKATVSRVLNNEPGVSDELRRQVKEAMAGRELPVTVGRTRPANIALIIGLNQPLLENFAAAILSGVAKYSFEQGVETSMLFMPASRARKTNLLKTVRDRRCNAAIMLFAAPFTEQLPEFGDSGIPTMLVAGRSEAEHVGYIDTDPVAGTRQAVGHLISLGHRRIGFLGGPMQSDYDHAQRLEGYRETMRDAHLPINDNWVIPHQPTLLTAQAGYEQALQLLDRASEITAMFANNDEMAYGAVRACVERGRRVPQDVSVVGFDDYPNSAYFNPPLTTVRQPMADMGYEAAKFVDTMARGVIERLPRRVLSGELVVRASSARAE